MRTIQATRLQSNSDLGSAREIRRLGNRTRCRRLLMADSHPIIRTALAKMINRIDGVVVCGEASTADDLLVAVRQLHPDMVVLDLSLNGVEAAELVQRVKARQSDLAVLVVVPLEDRWVEDGVRGAGANGCVSKQAGLDEMLGAIRRVASGGTCFRNSGNTLSLVEAVDQLSPRQNQVLELLGAGMGTRQISRHLNLSISTVETYRTALKEKFNLATGHELVQRAISWTVHSGAAGEPK